MSGSTRDRPLAPADDQFERYLTEKLWAWIPEVYRSDDDRAAEAAGAAAGVLRTMIEAIAGEAAWTRRRVDRLWEDPFIEVCDDWAIPLIGELVATRLVHELNRRGRRADVAKTIYYRRRAGTPMVAEALIRDITGWYGVPAEGFRRLVRAHHELDALPGPRRGPVTGTPPGGTARLPSVRGGTLAGGPFDEYAYTGDVRRLRGLHGRVGIPKLDVYLYRHEARELRAVTPFDLGGGRSTVDPSGRDAPLYAPAQRPDPDDCHPPAEWEMPAPIRCRLLGAAAFEITGAVVGALVGVGLPAAATDALGAYVGTRFDDEARLRETLASLPEAADLLAVLRQLVALAITDDSPKVHLYPTAIEVAVAGTPVPRERLVAANLADWGASLGLGPDVEAAIDPERGRVLVPGGGALSVPIHHVGRIGPFGAGTYERRDTLAAGAAPLPPAPAPGVGPIAVTVPATGVHQLADSRTYEIAGDLAGIDSLTVQAANGERPYVVRRADGTVPAWVLTAAAPSGTAPRELRDRRPVDRRARDGRRPLPGGPRRAGPRRRLRPRRPAPRHARPRRRAGAPGARRVRRDPLREAGRRRQRRRARNRRVDRRARSPSAPPPAAHRPATSSA